MSPLRSRTILIAALLSIVSLAGIGAGLFLNRIPAPDDIEHAGRSSTWQVVKESRRLDGHTDTVWSVAVSPDGKHGLSGTNDEVILWDLATGKEIKRFAASGFRLKFAHDGRHFFSEKAPGHICLSNLDTGAVVREFIGHRSRIVSLTLAPDGKYLAATSDRSIDDSGCARVWDVETGEEIARIESNGVDGKCVAFFPDGKRVLAIDQNCIHDWDLATGHVRPLAKRIRGRLRNTTDFHGFDQASISSQGGQWALIAAQQNVAVWDLQKGQIVRTWWPRQGTGLAVACSPTHFWGVTAGESFNQKGRSTEDSITAGDVRLWNLANGEELCTFEGHGNRVNCAVFTPDGRYVLTGSHDRTVRFWRLPGQ